MIEYPAKDDTSGADPEDFTKYITNFVNDFETVLYSDKYQDPDNGYEQYIDKQSFIDYLLVTEFSQNIDGLRFSTYLHKTPGPDGKLRMGPVWDYDIAYGNVYYASCHKTTGFRHNSHDPVHIMKLTWYDRLMQDRSFCVATVKRWRALRRTFLSNENVNTLIESLNDILKEAAGRNFKKWPILGRYVWPGIAPYAETYREEVDRLKYWLRQRFWWMDGMRCAKPHYRLFSKHVRRPDPPLLQTFTYINEVGKSYRKGDKQAILRTLAEAAAPPHCWTCARTQNSNFHGQIKWVVLWLWFRVTDISFTWVVLWCCVVCGGVVYSRRRRQQRAMKDARRDSWPTNMYEYESVDKLV